MSTSPNISTNATDGGLLQSFAEGGADMITAARPQLQVNDPKYVPTLIQFEGESPLSLNALNCGDPKSMSFAELESTCMDGLTALHDGNIHAKKTNEQRKELRLALRPYLLRVRDLLSKQGERNDCKDVPDIGWQAWVERNKHVHGVSLSTANRICGDKPKDKTRKLPKEGDIIVLFGKLYKVVSLPESEGEIHPFGNELENKFGASCQITIGLHLIGEVPKPARKKSEIVLEVGKTYFVRQGSRNELIETIYDGQDGDRHVFIPNGKTTGHRVLAKNAPKVWELDEQGELRAVKIPNKLVSVRKGTQ